MFHKLSVIVLIHKLKYTQYTEHWIMGREYIVWKRLSVDIEMKAFEDDFLTLWIKEENLIVNIIY